MKSTSRLGLWLVLRGEGSLSFTEALVYGWQRTRGGAGQGRWGLPVLTLLGGIYPHPRLQMAGMGQGFLIGEMGPRARQFKSKTVRERDCERERGREQDATRMGLASVAAA